jgi:hypothetical protein
MFFSLLLLAVPQGQVHVVDAAGGPGSDFTSVAAAVSAASDGDVVLVRAGDYLDFDGIFLTGKGLTVVTEPGASVVTDRIRILDLPSSSQVLIQGLDFQTDTIAADLDDDLGPMWFERCSFGPRFFALFGNDGFHPTNCDTVVLARCQLREASRPSPSAALLAENSRLHIFDSVLPGASTEGSLSAVVLQQGSFLELFGSTVHGGDGAPGTFLHCDGFAGGDALTLQNMSVLVTLDSLLVGGAGGAPFEVSCSPGADGEGLVVVGGTPVPLAGSARSLDVASPVRTDASVQASFTGLPGDRVWLKYSFQSGAGQSSRFYDGENLLGTPRFRAFSATIPASGTLVVTAPAPQLAPGEESLVVYCQAFFRDAAGQRFVLSSPSALVLLDASL